MAVIDVKAKVRAQPAREEVDPKDATKKVKIPATPEMNSTVKFDMPTSLAELTKAYGEEVAYTAAKGSVIISLQAFVRRMLEAGKKQDEIQAEVSKWKPDTKTIVRQSAFEKASGAIKSLSAEERAKLLKELQAAGGAK